MIDRLPFYTDFYCVLVKNVLVYLLQCWHDGLFCLCSWHLCRSLKWKYYDVWAFLQTMTEWLVIFIFLCKLLLAGKLCFLRTYIFFYYMFCSSHCFHTVWINIIMSMLVQNETPHKYDTWDGLVLFTLTFANNISCLSNWFPWCFHH